MLGIVYLLLCFCVGQSIWSVIEKKYAGAGFSDNENRLWVFFPASFFCGTLVVTWMVYLISWSASLLGMKEEPLLAGNAAAFATGMVCLYLGWKKRERHWMKIDDRERFKKEAVLFLILLLWTSGFMWYVFHSEEGILYAGYTVFGDYAPHTSVIRSFSSGNNFPTQYPHFGGEDIKYHFMFQFLAGNLEYLGMPLEWAFNSISILSMLGFLMILYSIAVRIFASFSTGAAAVVLFHFRSSFSFFLFLEEHIKNGDLWSTLKENTQFIGYTANEDWGLWNYNVYLNQRHLAFVLGIVGIVLLMYWGPLQEGCKSREKTGKWFCGLFAVRDAWKSRDPVRAAAAGILLGLCSFWNGAAVIGGLLILAGMGLFSKAKLDYALTGAIAVVLSLIQSSLFIKGSAVSPQFFWGFLAEDKTLAGVLEYLAVMSGIFFFGLPVLAVLADRMKKCLLLAFLLPSVFAFCVSLTPDIAVNHKYMMMTFAFMGIFWADLLVCLWHKKSRVSFTAAARGAAVLLMICLTITGVYDMVIIIKDNDSQHRVSVDLNSSTTAWLSEHTDSSDLVLTAQYSINEVTLSGIMLYCGWPYYAWSAGYDTAYRSEMAVRIYNETDEEQLRKLVEQEKITYIIYEDGMQIEGVDCREELIKQTYPLVFTSEDGRLRIYDTDSEQKTKE